MRIYKVKNELTGLNQKIAWRAVSPAAPSNAKIEENVEETHLLYTFLATAP